MAQSADIVWEVQTAGASNNGGGFKVGASGTDYSQQSSPQLSVTDAACTGNTTVTSATGGFTSAMIGNVIYLSSGPGWYEITGRTDTNTITIDRNGPNASGMTARVGGALNSLNTLASAMGTIGQWAFVKDDGVYTQTATPVFSLAGTPSNSQMYSRLSGYSTTRGDGGRARISLSTNSGLYGLSLSGSGWFVEGFDIDCNGLTTSRGINGGAYYNHIYNCKVYEFTAYGIISGTQISLVEYCEVSAGTSAGFGIVCNAGGAQHINSCWVHDNACPGIVHSSSNGTITNCLVTNNTGSSTDGIIAPYGLQILYNTIYGNGRHGIFMNTTFDLANCIRGNLIANHTAGSAAGIKFNSTGAIPARPQNDGNAFYNNTSNRVFGDKTDGIMALSPGRYTNVLDVNVTDGSPFVDAASNDFRLNGHPLRGGLLRGTSPAGLLPGLASQRSYFDFGCYQTNSTGSRSRRR